MTNTTKNIVTFNTTNQLKNCITGQTEDYLFETRVNGPLYKQSYIAKIVDAEYKTVDYEIYDMSIVEWNEKLSLKNFMMSKVQKMSDIDKKNLDIDSIYSCPDTNEEYSWKQIFDEFNIMILDMYGNNNKT